MGGFWDAVGRMIGEMTATFRDRITRCGLNFDEDVLNDTIDKCEDKYDKFDGSDERMMAYLWSAFKTNTIRELGYKRNDTEEITENVDAEDDVCHIDEMYGEVSAAIREKFGEDAFMKFFAHANGATYEELSGGGDVGKLKYLFRRIREDIRRTHPI